MEKIIITLPSELLSDVNRVAEELNSNRSKVIREALARYISDLRKKKEEALMVEGYKELAAVNEKEAESYLKATKDLGE